MTEAMSNGPDLTLTINGSKLAVGIRPGLESLDPPLRSVALSDSPVFVRAPEQDQPHLLDRLHRLGRRANLPKFECRTPEEAEPLFRILDSKGEAGDGVLGTWALHDVESWPESWQEKLQDLIESLDLARLHGRLRHERIPRIVVFSTGGPPNRLKPSLGQRVSYFTLIAEAHVSKEKE